MALRWKGLFLGSPKKATTYHLTCITPFRCRLMFEVHIKPLLQVVIIILLHALALPPVIQAQPPDSDLESSYRFLVSDRDTADGILYTATAGKLQGRRLPLSFADSAEYWGAYVCRLPGNTCIVTDIYNPQSYTLTPQKSPAGDLQTERINTHNGTNIYDAATWQIAVMLGQAINRFPLPNNQDAYALVSNQNYLLREGYNGNSSHAIASENRAVTAGKLFTTINRSSPILKQCLHLSHAAQELVVV